MTNDIKVEFEIKAIGEETLDGYSNSFKGYEIARIKDFSKETTLGELEKHIAKMYEEIKKDYGQQPEQLIAKVIITAKESEDKIIYLG